MEELRRIDLPGREQGDSGDLAAGQVWRLCAMARASDTSMGFTPLQA